MSSKIEINKVAEILKKNEIAPAILRRIVEEMNVAANPDGEGDGDKAPAVKKQYVVVVSDPDRHIPKGHDFIAWVTQIPDTESPVVALDRLHRAAYDYNASKKGRLLPVKTIGELMEGVPAKFFKEQDVWVRTKTPVLMLTTSNEIPVSTS